MHRMADHLSIASYLTRIGFAPYPWQADVLAVAHRGIVRGMRYRAGDTIPPIAGPQNPSRIWLGCARQSGKSEISAGIALWVSKMFPESFSLIVAPAKEDAVKTFAKIRRLAPHDPDIETPARDSQQELMLGNGSRALCVSLERARGHSAPDVIIIDEAARVPDEDIAAIRPTATTNPYSIQMMMSTPYGRRGFFWEAMDPATEWTKYQVVPAYELAGGRVVPRAEDEASFKARMAAQGIAGYYSAAHQMQWLESELQMLKSHLWRQEYGFEFLDSGDQVFSSAAVDRMFLADSAAWASETAGEWVGTAAEYEARYGRVPDLGEG